MKSIENILNLRLDNPDFSAEWTVRDYLHGLLYALWNEGEGFSGKRPFGYSGWEYDLYVPLVKSGEIGGSIDKYGYMEDMDKESADRLVFKLIDYSFGKTNE